MSGKYRDYGPKSCHLWMACGGMVDKGGVIDVGDPTFLAHPGRDGRERLLIVGPHAIRYEYACSTGGVSHRKWIRYASMAVSFAAADGGKVKAAREKFMGEAGGAAYAIRCSRASVAKALRGYRRRRDEMLAADRMRPAP